MAKDHFAIEQPRRISIEIQGYDANAVTRAQAQKLQERNQRLKRKQQAAPSGASAAVPPTAQAQAAETTEAPAVVPDPRAARKKKPRAGKASLADQLQAAFADQGASDAAQ